MIFAIFVPAAAKTSRYATLSMEIVHRVKSLAEAARRHGDFDDVGEVTFNGFVAGAAFIATHRAIFNSRPAVVKVRKRVSSAVL